MGSASKIRDLVAAPRRQERRSEMGGARRSYSFGPGGSNRAPSNRSPRPWHASLGGRRTERHETVFTVGRNRDETDRPYRVGRVASELNSEDLHFPLACVRPRRVGRSYREDVDAYAD